MTLVSPTPSAVEPDRRYPSASCRVGSADVVPNHKHPGISRRTFSPARLVVAFLAQPAKECRAAIAADTFRIGQDDRERGLSGQGVKQGAIDFGEYSAAVRFPVKLDIQERIRDPQAVQCQARVLDTLDLETSTRSQRTFSTRQSDGFLDRGDVGECVPSPSLDGGQSALLADEAVKPTQLVVVDVWDVEDRGDFAWVEVAVMGLVA